MKMLKPRRLFFVAALSLGLSLNANTSITGHPPLPQTAVSKTPDITIDPVSGEHRVRFSVLIYNIAGLPWPVKSGRAERLALIAGEFARLREQGRAPDLVLLQEAFMEESRDIIHLGGYPNYVTGPAAEEIVEEASPGTPRDFLAARSSWRGETWGKVMNSGLYILSDFPITGHEKTAFPRRDCAGWDCLANKGVMMASVHIPGVPFAIDVANTHMNSKGPSSGVDLGRTTAAQKLQLDTIHGLVARHSRIERPLVLAGDFNLKGLPEMVDYLRQRQGHSLASEYCLNARNCDMRLTAGSPTPWLDSNDLQAFRSAEGARLRPIKIELMFDENVGEEPLSDHDGYLVHYELSWQPEDFPQLTAGL
ncbi:hypothetical protein [Emcibacter sp.]|uniref:hypothetical protein n=1 Tax=Emcibacter sp. TaxID=1979954 RepID=UPI003A8D4AB4